jgi:very-short-patch-repair endonuclease
MSEKSIRRHVVSGRWIAQERGVYTVAGAPRTFEQRVMVAILGESDGAVASHVTSGVLFEIVSEQPKRLDVTVPHASHDGRRPGKLVHRARTLGAADVRRVDGMPTTCPNRTLVDLAGVLSFDRLEHALDNALNRGLVSIAALERYIGERHLGHLRGVGRLRHLLRDRKQGVPGSGVERAFLRLVRDAKLPQPSRQFLVGRSRLDFAYPDHRIAIELDHEWTHGTAQALRADLRRQNKLVLAGWLPLRFTRDDVLGHRELVLRTLEESLAGDTGTPRGASNLPSGRTAESRRGHWGD